MARGKTDHCFSPDRVKNYLLIRQFKLVIYLRPAAMRVMTIDIYACQSYYMDIDKSRQAPLTTFAINAAHLLRPEGLAWNKTAGRQLCSKYYSVKLSVRAATKKINGIPARTAPHAPNKTAPENQKTRCDSSRNTNRIAACLTRRPLRLRNNA